MGNSVKKYSRIFILGLQRGLEYRTQFLFSLTGCIFPIVIQFFLWQAVFSNSGSEVVYNFTFPQMIMYTVLAGLVSKFAATGFEYEITEDIKLGGFNKFIVQPIRYFQYRFFAFMGEKMINMAGMIIIFCLAFFLLSQTLGLTVPPKRLVLFIISLIPAVLMNFLIFYCLSAISFWAAEVSHLYEIFRILAVIVSGGIFPLDIFGPGVLAIVKYLPFTYITYFPINIVNGRLGFDEISGGFIIALGWLTFFALLSNLVWRFGEKKYVAVGG